MADLGRDRNDIRVKKVVEVSELRKVACVQRGLEIMNEEWHRVRLNENRGVEDI